MPPFGAEVDSRQVVEDMQVAGTAGMVGRTCLAEMGKGWAGDILGESSVLE